jgi:hypothetical protein
MARFFEPNHCEELKAGKLSRHFSTFVVRRGNKFHGHFMIFEIQLVGFTFFESSFILIRHSQRVPEH